MHFRNVLSFYRFIFNVIVNIIQTLFKTWKHINKKYFYSKLRYLPVWPQMASPGSQHFTEVSGRECSCVLVLLVGGSWKPDGKWWCKPPRIT